MAAHNAAIIRRFVDEIITDGKIESADRYVREDVVAQVPLPGVEEQVSPNPWVAQAVLLPGRS